LKGGIRLRRNICADDENWQVNTDATLGYKLDCGYYGTSTIIVREAILHFTGKQSEGTWRDGYRFERPNCDDSLGQYSAFRLNLTYTIQQECTSTLYKVTVGYNQGVQCLLRKEFLKANLFKLNRQVLQYETYAYPLPYGLHVIYSCE
jgi:hypothetical protein